MSLMKPPGTHIYHLKDGLQGIGIIIKEIESVLALYGWDEKKVYQVTLVLDELMTNIVCYGYPESKESMHVTLELVVSAEALHLTLKDDGIAFDPLKPRNDPPISASVEDRPIGGLGIYLTQTFMDHISYKRQENTNILTLTSTLKRKE